MAQEIEELVIKIKADNEDFKIKLAQTQNELKTTSSFFKNQTVDLSQTFNQTSNFKKSFNEILSISNQIGNTLKNSICSAIETGEFNLREFASSMFNIFAGVAESISSSIANSLIQGLSSSMSGGFNLAGLFGGGGGSAGGSIFSSLLGGLGGIFGGFRADGGPVSSNSAYIVGEKEAEIFVPKTSGQIIPKSALTKENTRTLGASSSVVINISAMDSQDTIRALSKTEVQKYLGANTIKTVQKTSNKKLNRSSFE